MADERVAANPFILHRRQLDVYRHALAAGVTDEEFCDLVTDADNRVAQVDGHGFRVTPVIELGGVPAAAKPVLAKIETGNVGGSHKARHLFGLLLYLLLEERTTSPGELAGGRGAQSGGARGGSAQSGSAQSGGARGGRATPLAIASCGNAALGAAVVARAAERTLRVFVPTDADPTIVARLDDLGAEVAHCERRPGESGDPCVARLHDAVAGGARPFTVQGPMCPDVIDGGRTLGLELAAQLDTLDVLPRSIYIQIGGGALATAVMDGLARAWPDRRLPALHPVQAESAHPYVAASRRFAARALASIGVTDPGTDAERGAILSTRRADVDVDDLLDQADETMVPWPGTPTSVASGILDDVTYDWRTVLRHQIETGGHPILVAEETFVAARALAAGQADPPPTETGAAGLAGLLTHAASAPEAVAGPTVVLLTG